MEREFSSLLQHHNQFQFPDGYSMNDVRYLWVKDYRTGDPKIRVSKETTQSVRHEIKAVRGKDHQIEFASGELPDFHSI